eukprot:393306_1
MSSLVVSLFFLLAPIALSKRENILLILVDDLGNSDASFNFNLTHPNSNLADAPIPTPHLDYLAHSGIIFSNHYTHYICGPSRCALLTSRYSVHLGNPFDIPSQGGGLAQSVVLYNDSRYSVHSGKYAYCVIKR